MSLGKIKEFFNQKKEKKAEIARKEKEYREMIAAEKEEI